MEQSDPQYKHNGFKVPEGYFESLDDKVMARLHTAQAPVLSVWRKKTTWLAAASIALVCSIGYFSYASWTSGPADISFENIESSELLAFTDDLELSEEEFEELIPAQAIDSIYNAEITMDVNTSFDAMELQDLEEAYSPLDTNTDL